MGSKRIITNYASPGEVALAGALMFRETAKESLEKQGRFLVALSGGSTPKGMFGILAQPPFQDAFDWAKCHLFWSDERSVPPDHADSNFKMAYDHLLTKVPIQHDQVHRMKGEAGDLGQAAREYQETIARVLGNTQGPASPPAFDLIYLGMGGDGHTASLFPHTTALKETQAWVVSNVVPKLNTTRLTFTYPLINSARKVVFLAAGKDKASPLARVLEGPPDCENYPSQGVQTVNGIVYWLIDQDAGGQLSPETLSNKGNA